MAGTISNPAGSVTTGYSVPASLFIADAGSESAPSYTFSGDLNTGMFSPGADQLGFTTGGTTRLTLSTTAFTSTLPITATSFTVTGSTIPTNGLYLPAANTVGMATDSASRLVLDSSVAAFSVPVSVTAATATLTATSSTGTNRAFFLMANTGGNYYFGAENSAGNGIFGTGGTAYSLAINASGARSIQFGTTDIVRMTLGAAGGLTLVAGNDLTLADGDLIITTATTPASAAAAGVAGTVAWDADYIYICTATNTWKRVGIATW